MTAAMNLHAIAQMAAARLVDCLVEGTLVAAFTGLVLRLVRRQNPGARFAVWFSALMAMAALPLLGGAGWSDGSATLTALARRPEITLPGSWAVWLFWTWAGIAGIGLARVGVGLWRLATLRRSCVKVDSARLDSELQETLAGSGAAHGGKIRPAALYVSDQVSVPTAIGFAKPAIVIPGWLLQELSVSELKQVVLHERAHLRRWDDWTNLAQKIVKAVLFFHPAVWWIEKQVSLEREMACDDAVLAETANPRAYAECLTHLAEKSFVRRGLALAQAALGRVRQTSLRVAQILDSDRPAATRHGWKAATGLVAAFAVVCAVGVSRAPRLVGFEDRPSTQMAGAAAGWSGSATVALSFTSPADERASLATPGGTLRPVKAKFRRQRPRAILAKSERQNFDSERGGFFGAGMVNAHAPEVPSIAADLFHLTDFSTNSVIVTETVFVIVEGRVPGSAGAATYRISVWRVVLRQPAGNSNPNLIPHKET